MREKSCRNCLHSGLSISGQECCKLHRTFCHELCDDYEYTAAKKKVSKKLICTHADWTRDSQREQAHARNKAKYGDKLRKVKW